MSRDTRRKKQERRKNQGAAPPSPRNWEKVEEMNANLGDIRAQSKKNANAQEATLIAMRSRKRIKNEN
jgi:hypothetical protein